jgi:hypothetical protein
MVDICSIFDKVLNKVELKFKYGHNEVGFIFISSSDISIGLSMNEYFGAYIFFKFNRNGERSKVVFVYFIHKRGVFSN